MSGVLRSIKSAIVKPFGYEVASRTETKTITKDFIRLATKDNPTPLKLIRLGGNLYKIRYTDEDKQRRNDHFINGNESLTEDETKLLNDIGITDIDKQLSKNTKNLMPMFYDSLPDCQTSTAISLSAKCFLPHHIISEIIEQAAVASEIDAKKSRKESPTSDETIKTMGLLNGISDLISGAFPSESTPSIIDESSMYDFFLLRI